MLCSFSPVPGQANTQWPALVATTLTSLILISCEWRESSLSCVGVKQIGRMMLDSVGLVTVQRLPYLDENSDGILYFGLDYSCWRS